MLCESLNDALVECVKSAGGSKVVGPAIWPAKGIEAAQRHLLSCLNPDRNEKLGPDEVLMVLRLAREVGCHVGMQYLAAALSYTEPAPVQPKDEADELRRQVLEMGRQLQAALGRIEKLDRPALKARLTRVMDDLLITRNGPMATERIVGDAPLFAQVAIA